MRARPGFSLAELLLACSLASAVGALLLGALSAQLRLARATAQRAAAADAVRTASLVLDGEARWLHPSEIGAAAPDSVAIRAFRGAAVPCRLTSGGVLVRYRGVRQPNPVKDSILAIGPDRMRALSLSQSRPVAEGCPREPDEHLFEWRLSENVTDAALLLFESGSYYLAARALRYRIGAEGRQPLTAETFAHPGTRFRVDDDGLRYTLQVGHDTITRKSWWLRTAAP